MRLDKYLKTSSLIKRRVIAKEAAESHIIYVNDKIAKPSTLVKVNDVIKLEFARKTIIVKVISITKIKDEPMFDLLEEIKK